MSKRRNKELTARLLAGKEPENIPAEYTLEAPTPKKSKGTKNKISSDNTETAAVSNVQQEFIPENESSTIKNKKEKVLKRKLGINPKRILECIILILCVYVAILIYGVIVTDYEYIDGKATPKVESVSEIRDEKEYSVIIGQYEQMRKLYEKSLMLDYRLSAGEEDPLTIAPEYEGLLDEVSALSIKTDALVVDMKFSQTQGMMLSWIQNDIAVYLQNMSSAISENNSIKAENALTDRSRTYSNFCIVTENIAAMAESMGMDVSDIESWNPDDYISSTINSQTDKEDNILTYIFSLF